MNKRNLLGTFCAAFAIAALVSSCGDGTTRSTGFEFSPNMYEPLAFNPDQPNKNFKDGMTAQTPPKGTTPIGFVRFDYPSSNEGYEQAGAEILTNPLEVTKANLEDGHTLFVTYCAVCHGPEGKGDGPITADRSVEDSRGKRDLENFPPPPSYQQSDNAPSSRGGQVYQMTPGKIYHTITYGWGSMGSHASQISPEDRWKVVMYVQQLQKK